MVKSKVKPKVLVLVGYGINCDDETLFAFSFEQAGAHAEKVHINSLISGEKRLKDYQILALPGGFSYGDDIASGKVLANKLKYNLEAQILHFIEEKKLIIGICNGFQVLVKYPLLPKMKEQLATLTFNDSGRFECRWVYLKNFSKKCIFTRGIDKIALPVAHFEGKFITKAQKVLKELYSKELIVFKYTDENGKPAQGKYPANPNGSLDDIAGISSEDGRIFGLMPHPERFLHFTNHPLYTKIKEELKREGKEIPEEGAGLKIFRNAVEYFS